MERNDLYQASNSLRANGSSRWRDTGYNVFSRSFRQEDDDDDEEALKWAAIERLPTFARLKKALLTISPGETSEVDVPKLGHEERKKLMDRLIKHTEKDNESFLLKCFLISDRVGIEIPKLEVRYEHLKVEAEAYIGSRALPSFFNFFINKLESILHCLHLLSTRKKQLSILRDVSGTIRPCRMTLLLGPPSSGKTTLLLALAGKLNRDLKFSGRVTYNGHEMKDFVPQRIAAYIGQNDLHLPEWTVRETIAFSARCQGVGPSYEMLAELARREKAANIKPDPDIDAFMKAASVGGQETSVITDYIIKILGLENCADTLVGNEMIRGISGGQRKRVTTGEMLAGPAKLLLMDEISTGLDSSTTYQIVKSLRQKAHILNGTAFISLLQPAPETFELFDDIVLLSDGQIVYQGPRENVLEFFKSMGFKCPARKGVADFLQEVTSRKDQRQYWNQTDKAYSFVTVEEFAEAFQSFHVGKRLQDDLATPFDKNRSDPTLLTTKNYGVNKMELIKACFSKELLLMKRNSFIYIFKLIQLVVMAVIGSTVFLRTEMHKKTPTDGIVQMGAVFFSVFMFMFSGLLDLAMTGLRLPVFFKQRDNLFYPAWVYALPTWILNIPISFIEVALWVVVTYYAMGLDPDIFRFLKQFLLLVLTNQMSSALFRLVAALGREMTVTNTLASFCLLVLFANCGYVLSQDEVRKWWIWAYWISPMMYSQNAIVINEFLGESWNHRVKSGDQNNEDDDRNGVDAQLQHKGSNTGNQTWMDKVSGLSLEQRKRLTIAVELVANPSIIFMDEPTSGLDARAAAIVMRTVRNTVDTGRTVVCTIHQPGIDIFEAFDELLLLKQGGEEIYVGPLGHNSCDMIKYFEGIEGISRIKDGNNPATWMLEVSTPEQEMALGVDFADLYERSELHKRNKALTEQLNVPSPGSKQLHFPTRYSQSFFSQFLVCLWKQRWSYWRNTSYTAVRFFFTTVIALMFGTMFWNVGSKRTRYQDLFNSMGSMYAAVLFLGVQNAASIQPIVHIERTVFYREKAAGMYSPMAYAFAQVVVELPYILVQAATYGIIVYSMMAFEWSAAKFLWYIFFMYFTLLYFTFFGMMTMAITPNFHVAAIISTAFYGLWNLFTGFIVPRTRIPIWWRWNYWICPMAWTLYGLIVSQYGDVKDVLDAGETTEEFLKKYFGFRHDFVGVVAAVIVGWALLFAFLFAVSIKLFNFQRR
ncbi:hypothetical protein GOBAR_DD10505 [Gossypium barbadense]|nr:hypothetical protein GOBAR_DD10505 [Gossypium barbadense]